MVGQVAVVAQPVGPMAWTSVKTYKITFTANNLLQKRMRDGKRESYKYITIYKI